MPKSFMISHTRFVANDDNTPDALSPLAGDGTITGFCEEVGAREMMSKEGCERDNFGNKATGSEGYQRRPLVSQKSLDKSYSDGESDSGCSSLYEGRHELPAEAEFSLACPSSLSFLFDLMTQSPQRNSGRDVLDLSCDSKCPQGQEEMLYSSKLIKMKQQAQPQDRRPDIMSSGSHEDYGMATAGDQHFPFPPFITNAKTPRDNNRYVFESSPESKSVSESIFPRNDLCAESSYLGNSSSTLDTVMAADTLLHLHETNYPGTTTALSPPLQLTSATHAQRKICFDNRPSDLSCRSSKEPEMNYDEPIDYSQLSSRRRSEGSLIEYKQTETDLENFNEIKREQWSNDKRVQMKSLQNPSARPLVNDHRYEFILTPQLSADGKLVLSKSNVEYDQMSPVGSENERKMNGEVQHPCQTAVYPTLQTGQESGGYSMQSSPLSASPATPVNSLSDVRSRVSPDPSPYTRTIKSVMERDILKEDTETIYRKIAYHPKLKYLLASSQNRSVEDKVGTEQNLNSGTPTKDAISRTPKEKQMGEITQDVEQQRQVQHNQMHMYRYAEDIGREPQNIHDTHSKETSFSSLGPQNHYGYGSLRKCSYKINIHETESSNHNIRTSSETISSMIAQINQISKSNDTSTRNMSGSQSISIISNRTISPNHSVSCHSSMPYGPVSPTPSSLSSSPSDPNPSRDQQSALTELLFSTSARPTLDPYACSDCGKRYSTSSNLARHRQTHRSVCDKKARKCPHCEKVYVSMPAFSMHVRTHNQGCECPHCGKKFSRPWLLQGHIRTHTGEKPFGCPQCGKSFADKSNLRAHIQTHSTEKPYVCGRCGKAFALKSYLYKHEESSCMRGQRLRH